MAKKEHLDILISGVDNWNKWRAENHRIAPDLSEAYMAEAYMAGAILPHFQIPQEGKLIVWKAITDCIAKLEIPENARRTACLRNRKCRAECARTLWLSSGKKEAVSERGGVYCIGELIYPDSYDPDIRVDCSNGIHFFLTREEAEEWL